jgi:hypothetical protein
MESGVQIKGEDLRNMGIITHVGIGKWEEVFLSFANDIKTSLQQSGKCIGSCYGEIQKYIL